MPIGPVQLLAVRFDGNHNQSRPPVAHGRVVRPPLA